MWTREVQLVMDYDLSIKSSANLKLKIRPSCSGSINLKHPYSKISFMFHVLYNQQFGREGEIAMSPWFRCLSHLSFLKLKPTLKRGIISTTCLCIFSSVSLRSNIWLVFEGKRGSNYQPPPFSNLFHLSEKAAAAPPRLQVDSNLTYFPTSLLAL